MGMASRRRAKCTNVQRAASCVCGTLFDRIASNSILFQDLAMINFYTCMILLPIIYGLQDNRTTSSFSEYLKLYGDAGTYKAYIETQQSKLSKLSRKIVLIDIGRQKQIVSEFVTLFEKGRSGIKEMSGKSILCLGARLGGEVRAFKSLGALAIGLDLNPGPSSLDVLSGDFHNIAYPNESFDFAYSNVLDHIFDQNAFASEVARILKPKSYFFASVYPDSFDAWTGPDAVSLRNKDAFIEKFKSRGFEVIDELHTTYSMKLTHFKTWDQKISTYILRKL